MEVPRTRLRASALALVACVSCSDRDRYNSSVYTPCPASTIRCADGVAEFCNASGEGVERREVCEGQTPLCVPDVGCAYCIPGERRCQGQTVLECDVDGIGWGMAETCMGDDVCYDGACGGPCARAGLFRSYEGCDYRAVTLMNSQLASDFAPAVVVSNRNPESVTVTVSLRDEVIAERIVAPSSTATVELPWNESLKGSGLGESVNIPGAAYRVETSLPVTVYQFNPLEYALPRDCRDGDVAPGDSHCNSFSNDASLLLPVPVLTGHYIVMSRANLGLQVSVEGMDYMDILYSPSVLAVVNPHDRDVEVTVRLSAPTVSVTDRGTFEPGEEVSFRIAPDGVLQLAAASPDTCTADFVEPDTFECDVDVYCRYSYCALSDRDLTGTEISASAPVAVFGAHDCAFVPYNRWACDHLEEQLFPYETWGRRFVVTQSAREQGEPDVVRVLSGSDGNVVRFEPATVHEPVSLDRGQHFELETWGAFEMTSDGPIMVGQFIVGQSYSGLGVEELPPGDPSFSLVVPVEQYRAAYNFLAPDSFDRSYINLTAAAEGVEALLLDGAPLPEVSWTPVGDTEFLSVSFEVEPGSHEVVAGEDQLFGITVYGYGQYTSYMYPGGLDLEPIAVW